MKRPFRRRRLVTDYCALRFHAHMRAICAVADRVDMHATAQTELESRVADLEKTNAALWEALAHQATLLAEAERRLNLAHSIIARNNLRLYTR